MRRGIRHQASGISQRPPTAVVSNRHRSRGTSTALAPRPWLPFHRATRSPSTTLDRVGDTLTTLISEDLIKDRVAELAAQIDEDYRHKGDLILIGVLKGSFMFLSDLTRRLTIPHRVEFISVSSYGDRESEDPGAVRLILDVRHDIGGRHVIIVEDIVDTGHTLSYLIRLLQARLPTSLTTCTLLRKPDRAQVDVHIDYLGFDIPDVWVVGYGLDFAERYRTLPRICAMKAP